MPVEDDSSGTGPGIAALGVNNSCCFPAPPKRIPHAMDERIVVEYVAGKTQSAIALEFGVCRESVKRRLRQLGVPPDVGFARIRKPLNQLAFAKVTEESAYWAGFLMADGCVHRPKQGQA
ncbi:MAG: helix-turn-helix domain-containing protein, partial [Thermoplasmata archaeon]